jgi:hypothetical protein
MKGWMKKMKTENTIFEKKIVSPCRMCNRAYELYLYTMLAICSGVAGLST